MDIGTRVVYWIIVAIALGGVSELISCMIAPRSERRLGIALLVFIALAAIVVALVLLSDDQSDSPILNQRSVPYSGLPELWVSLEANRIPRGSRQNREVLMDPTRLVKQRLDSYCLCPSFLFRCSCRRRSAYC